MAQEQGQQGRPNTARVYDYWLGAANNFAEDREHGERMKQVLPEVPGARWCTWTSIR